MFSRNERPFIRSIRVPGGNPFLLVACEHDVICLFQQVIDITFEQEGAAHPYEAASRYKHTFAQEQRCLGMFTSYDFRLPSLHVPQALIGVPRYVSGKPGDRKELGCLKASVIG